MKKIFFTLFFFIVSAPTVYAAKNGKLCVNESTGSIIAASRRCPSGYAVLNKNTLSKITASTITNGALGATGPQGPQGPKGVAGDKGPDGESGFDKIPSGKTVHGVVGGMFSVGTNVGANIAGWSQAVSLPSLIDNGVSSADIIVVYNDLFSSCTQNAPNRQNYNCLNSTDTSQSALCTGSVDNPTAPRGKICIYTTVLNNAYSVKGELFAKSKNGFQVSWISVPSESLITDFEAVWAYTAS